LLKVEGKFIFVGLPDEAELRITPFMLNSSAVSISATHLGSRKEMMDMLSLAAEKHIEAWVEEIPLSKHNLADAVARLEHHNVHYRFWLIRYSEALE
jgi:alcohol dehydrogenase (NADP+)